jgi:hypothetical protein
VALEQTILGTQTAEHQKALETFVVDNDDLLALESIIGRFNIFDALNIARAEIRHSNFLAFILDPAESHGQGQVKTPDAGVPTAGIVISYFATAARLVGFEFPGRCAPIRVLPQCRASRFRPIQWAKMGAGLAEPPRAIR